MCAPPQHALMAGLSPSQNLPLPLEPLPLPPPLSPTRSFAVSGASPRCALNQLRIIWSFSGMDKGGCPHAARRFSSSSMSLYTPTLTTGDLSRFGPSPPPRPDLLGGDLELELDGDLRRLSRLSRMTLTLTSAWRPITGRGKLLEW
eukprot:CAMPEP_0117587922 /NCGR_PEP_ID=MMETSP0784-20121206/69568_1 /TAXON_ID=39447 /ORGANISM="" /LENGTH=145 /DNA_ID=CAMNT_0005389231 /DNA_START=139 /DNA_END=573 /DNA_ORIENTATION=+